MYTVYIVNKDIITHGGKIKKGNVVMGRKEYDIINLIFLKDGNVQESYVAEKFNKFLTQIGFKFERLQDYSMDELAMFLACRSELEFTKTSVIIINEKLKRERKRANDYWKLYDYWRKNCIYNTEAYRSLTPDKYTIISYDYKKIKQDNMKVNNEIIRKFNLFGGNEDKRGH